MVPVEMEHHNERVAHLYAPPGSSPPSSWSVSHPTHHNQQAWVNNPSFSGKIIEGPATPHKLFVWDLKGTYVDYSFPNPHYGHFLNPAHLKGTRVKDLFLKSVSTALLQKIAAAWETGRQQNTVLLFEREGRRYEAAVTCVASNDEHVHGFVIDRLVGARQVSGVSNGFRKTTRQKILSECPQVTPQQSRIVQGVMAGLTNRTIADHLGITERTVKSHLYKIFEKLGVTNRYGLLSYLAQAGLFVGPVPSLPKAFAIIGRKIS